MYEENEKHPTGVVEINHCKGCYFSCKSHRALNLFCQFEYCLYILFINSEHIVISKPWNYMSFNIYTKCILVYEGL